MSRQKMVKNSLVVMTLLLMLCVPAKVTKAAVQLLPKKATVMSVANPVGAYPQDYIFRLPAKVTSVYSSNPKVATIHKDGTKEIEVYPYKLGTTNLTVWCGKKKYTCKFKLIAYRNPFKQLSVCGKDIKNVFKKGNTEDQYANVAYVKSKKGKVSIKVNSSFKLKQIKINGKIVKNNSKITWKNNRYGESRIKVTVYNKLTSETEIYETGLR